MDYKELLEERRKITAEYRDLLIEARNEIEVANKQIQKFSFVLYMLAITSFVAGVVACLVWMGI